jgi:hypothetical protein
MADVDVPTRVRELAARLGEPKPMRRGSISSRMVKCNKPGCPCGERPEGRHGPYVSWVRVIGGKTQSRWVRPDRAEIVRRQVEAGQQFRKHLESYWEACEKWADAELEATSEVEVAKKGGSKKPSRRKSAPRSRRS